MRISRSGAGLHWDDIDEDLTIAGLISIYGDESLLESRLKSVSRSVKVDPDDW